ncbi:MAG: serine/threonine protein kinase [Proteobacteria bacterium]|nr:serine/threonine protein kinase [Pseudomonadota bacterium]
MTSQINEINAAAEETASEQTEIRTPEILNLDYRYIRLLGEGANGRTWLARDRRTGLDVAIKELKFAEDFKSYELFQREAEVLQSVRVEGVPRFIKSVSLPDMTSYIVQEYIPYPSLESRLDKGEIFDEEEVYKILELVSRILFALQTQYVPAIIHRDIKPGNILYCPETATEDAKAWLIDFGAVDNAHKQTSGSTIAGTFGYMSPEQSQGEVSPRSDFYSLGATALHLLTGVFPYDIPRNLFQMQFRPVIQEKAPKTTKPMVDFLDALLASNAEDRPQDIKELRTLLKDAMDASEKYRGIKMDFEPVVDEPRTALGRKFRSTKAGQWLLKRKIARLRKKFEKDIQRQIDDLERTMAEEKNRREEEERRLQEERAQRGIECTCSVRRVSVVGKVRINMDNYSWCRENRFSAFGEVDHELNFDESLMEGLFTHEGNWYAAYLPKWESDKTCDIRCTLDAPEDLKITKNEFKVWFIPSKMDIAVMPKQVIWLTPQFYMKFTGHKPLSLMTAQEREYFEHPEKRKEDAAYKKRMERELRRREWARKLSGDENTETDDTRRFQSSVSEAVGMASTYLERLQRLKQEMEKNQQNQ